MLDPECFDYRPAFLERQDADALLVRLWDELEWVQREVIVFNRRVLQPRLIAWYGDPGATYTYSGLTLEPLPWHAALCDLKLRLEHLSGKTFNAVLANAYRNGRDSMGWHSDDEPELGPEPVIASVSLGCERRLLVRRRPLRGERPGASTAMLLGHGSVLLMKGPAQRQYQHSLPKSAQALGLRINLTFRRLDRA